MRSWRRSFRELAIIRSAQDSRRQRLAALTRKPAASTSTSLPPTIACGCLPSVGHSWLVTLPATSTRRPYPPSPRRASRRTSATSCRYSRSRSTRSRRPSRREPRARAPSSRPRAPCARRHRSRGGRRGEGRRAASPRAKLRVTTTSVDRPRCSRASLGATTMPTGRRWWARIDARAWGSRWWHPERRPARAWTVTAWPGVTAIARRGTIVARRIACIARRGTVVALPGGIACVARRETVIALPGGIACVARRGTVIALRRLRAGLVGRASWL